MCELGTCVHKYNRAIELLLDALICFIHFISFCGSKPQGGAIAPAASTEPHTDGGFG